MRQAIINVFARMPRRGAVKTRLAAGIGTARALRFHRAATLATLAKARAVDHATTVLWTDGGVWHPLFSSLPAGSRRVQPPGNLGHRMSHALAWSLQRAERAIVVGTDCPGLSSELLSAAIAALVEAEVVIGPALDGGYYLIGVRRSAAAAFRHIDWGSADVLRQTLRQLRRSGLSRRLLDPLPDVDCADDLALLTPEERRRLALL